jgi:predicted membrane-bound spermidine synthase
MNMVESWIVMVLELIVCGFTFAIISLQLHSRGSNTGWWLARFVAVSFVGGAGIIAGLQLVGVWYASYDHPAEMWRGCLLIVSAIIGFLVGGAVCYAMTCGYSKVADQSVNRPG